MLDMKSFPCMPSAGRLEWRLWVNMKPLVIWSQHSVVIGWDQGPREHVLILASRTSVSSPTSPCRSGISGVLWNYWCLKRQKNVKPLFDKLSEKQKHKFQYLLQPSDSRNWSGLGADLLPSMVSSRNKFKKICLCSSTKWKRFPPDAVWPHMLPAKNVGIPISFWA